MSSSEDFDRLVGAAALDEVLQVDALFDRLARRDPGPDDLDDGLAASLALLAGDVDLQPVPVDDTRRALAAAGVWPPAALLVGPRTPSEGAHLPRSTEPAPSPAADADAVPLGGLPRVLRVRLRLPKVRPAVGLTVAASLVVLGGGLTALVAVGDSDVPLISISTFWGDQKRTTARHDELAKQLGRARVLMREGHTVEAATLVSDVKAHLTELPAAERRDLIVQVTRVEGELGSSGAEVGDASIGDAATAAPAGDPGSVGSGASSTGSSAGSSAGPDGRRAGASAGPASGSRPASGGHPSRSGSLTSPGDSPAAPTWADDSQIHPGGGQDPASASSPSTASAAPTTTGTPSATVAPTSSSDPVISDPTADPSTSPPSETTAADVSGLGGNTAIVDASRPGPAN